MIRPTRKELFHKIKAARESLTKGRIALLNQTAMACDAIELDYAIDIELMVLLPKFLNGLTPLHYIGQNPPQRSYTPEIAGVELLAFKLDNSVFESPVYIKFAYADEILWLVSLHSDRETAER